MNRIPVIITHNGNFQPDDILSVATLKLILGEIKLIRTRDLEIIKTGDYVVDVGGEFNPKDNRFDHHQEGGAGVRENGIPYASFGLVWKTYGEKLCKSKLVAERIENTVVQAIDADDVGLSPTYEPKVPMYLFVDSLYSFVPNWNQPDSLFDEGFKRAVDFAGVVLNQEIEKIRSLEEAREYVEKAYRESSDKRIIVLDRPYPATEVVTKYSEPLYVIKPGRQRDYWKVKAVSKSANTIVARKLFPESWAAKKGEFLQKVSGVSDADFCHKDRWVAAAKSKEGVVKMAKIAADF